VPLQMSMLDPDDGAAAGPEKQVSGRWHFMISLCTMVIGASFFSGVAVRLFGLALVESYVPSNVLFWAFSLGNVRLLDHISGDQTSLSSNPAAARSDAWLFRSGSPGVFGSWAALAGNRPAIDADALRWMLQSAAPEMPVEDVELVDVCLLGGPYLEAEEFMVDTEKSFFAQNPAQGEFHQMPMPGLREEFFESACAAANIQGSRCPSETRQPRDITDADRRTLVEGFPEWDPNGLIKRVEQLHRLLHNSSAARPRAVFFHCQCGCDRTGMVAAAYEMAYRGVTFQATMAQNVAIAGRPMYYRYQVGLQWYCEWLRANGRYSDNDCSACDQPGLVCQEQRMHPDRWFVKLADVGLLILGIALALSIAAGNRFTDERSQLILIIVRLATTRPRFSEPSVAWKITASEPLLI